MVLCVLHMAIHMSKHMLRSLTPWHQGAHRADSIVRILRPGPRRLTDPCSQADAFRHAALARAAPRLKQRVAYCRVHEVFLARPHWAADF